MDIAEALRDLGAALAAAEGARGRDARLRAARQVVADRCVTALGLELPGQPSIAAVIKLAADAPDRPARRDCAVLVVHALAVPGLVPAACAGDVYSLLESALRDALLRCSYRFGGSIDEKARVLERLHTTIGELMEPLEPTFPGWIRGLHAG
jgi:hypothetical protein